MSEEFYVLAGPGQSAGGVPVLPGLRLFTSPLDPLGMVRAAVDRDALRRWFLEAVAAELQSGHGGDNPPETATT